MILTTLLWSMAGVITRHLDSAASFEITFWRSAFSSLSLAVLLSVMRGLVFWRRLLHAPKEIWISGVCWSIMFTAFMMAITLTTVANALIMLALGPLITALFARFFLNHRLPVFTWLAIALAGIGIASMFMHEGDERFSVVGSLVALAVPLAGAVNFTLLQHVGLGKAPKPAISANQPVQDMLQAVLIGAVLSTLSTLPLSLPIQASIHDIGLLSILGVFQLSIPCLLVVRLSRELSAPEISLLTQLEVIFGVTWAWLWAGENLSTNTLAGGSLVLGALIANESARMFRERRARAARLNYREPVELRALPK
jgi:drug/metabolite transporter (DMT)-like permease